MARKKAKFAARTQPAKEDGPPLRSIARNRRAKHEYNVLEELECGIVLVGTEVKSLREGRCSLQEAYVVARAPKGKTEPIELWLVQAHIPEYSHGNKQNHTPVHDRKLLARRREVRAWHRAAREKGVTMVPLEIYFKGSLIKLSVALVRGKKLHDKRRAERDKSDAREMRRESDRRR